MNKKEKTSQTEAISRKAKNPEKHSDFYSEKIIVLISYSPDFIIVTLMLYLWSIPSLYFNLPWDMAENQRLHYFCRRRACGFNHIQTAPENFFS